MKTVVGLFDSFQEAHDAVRDLEACGFNHDNISIVAQKDVLGGHEGYATGTGAAIGAGLGILAGLTAVVVPGVGIVLALGPIIAGGVLGAVAGGLIGSLIDAGVPAEEAEFYHEGVRRGGTLVMVSADDPDAARAAELLCRHHPVDVNERGREWRQGGWTPEGATATPPPLPNSPAASNKPDATGKTTMGDAAAEMPKPIDHSEPETATASSHPANLAHGSGSQTDPTLHPGI